jgi:catechol 2,3-dioxygenase-like lactoylglutathione lyase family enzyme
VFDHVTIRVSDRSASEPFYDTVLATLGIAQTYADEDFVEWGDFSLAEESEGKPVTRRLHVGFAAGSRERVDEFWRAGTAAGYRSDGKPGARPEYGEDYYGGFLLDPDGNSIEAVHHGAVRDDTGVDHVWVRVADVAASRAFYETIAPHAGFRLETDTPERAQFAAASGSFSVVLGEPTAEAHLAFPAAARDAVHEFHAAATAAGYRDNGAPGPRPEYGEGYYAAFVLDPDGNNVEVVNHGG